MRLSKAWIIAAKEFRIFRKKKSIVYTILVFELVVSIAFPLIVRYSGARSGGIPASLLPRLLDSFSFWYVIGAAVLPMSLASYSIVGEKVQKSLEPLLATPTTDGEILAGKGIAAFIPAVAASWAGSVLFMILMDRITHSTLGYYYYPNWNIAVIALVLAPLTALLSIGANVLVSSRSSDVRAAQQMGALIVLPFGVLYVLSEIGVISLTARNLLIIAAVLAVLDIIAFYVVKATFQREEILTKWK